MPNHPLAEVFGYPINNTSDVAQRHRNNRLCPYHNRIINCTKDKAKNPLGVCSVWESHQPVITCPVRFRQEGLVVSDAAAFFFPEGSAWTSLSEIRLDDKYGKSAGNIDHVLVSYDGSGNILDFGALEVQAVYVSGNIREPFEHFMQAPDERADMSWPKSAKYPHPDYRSSSIKRLAPQLIFKGGIINSWSKKQAVALDSAFYSTLPVLPEVPVAEADMVWLIYDLVLDEVNNQFRLSQNKRVYTKFENALDRIKVSEAGDMELFIKKLQTKLKKVSIPTSMPPMISGNENP